MSWQDFIKIEPLYTYYLVSMKRGKRLHKPPMVGAYLRLTAVSFYFTWEIESIKFTILSKSSMNFMFDISSAMPTKEGFGPPLSYKPIAITDFTI